MSRRAAQEALASWPRMAVYEATASALGKLVSEAAAQNQLQTVQASTRKEDVSFCGCAR